MDSQYDLEIAARVIARLKLPDAVSIRPWAETDFPAIQRLSLAEEWPSPADRAVESLEAWRDSWPTLVVTEEDTVIGFVRGISDGHITTYIAELLVAPAWRGRHIGEALLTVAQALVPGTRLDLLAVGQSRGFYEHVGFRQFAGFRRSSEENTCLC